MVNLIYTLLCIRCLCIGFFVGYKIGKGEKVQVSIPNAVKTVKEKIETKKQNDKISEQLEELNKIYYNIEHYDGTPNGQKEVKGIEIGL